MWSNAVRIVLAGAAMSLAFAPSASADTAGFLHAVVPTYNNVSPQQLLAAGNKACDAIRGGMNSTNAVLLVQKDIGVSIPAAGDVVSAAVVHLGC
jgi:hypothetical protein